MKKFNQMKEKHMAKACGGAFIFVPLILAVTGVIAGVCATAYESKNKTK